MRQDRRQLGEHGGGKYCSRHTEKPLCPEENYQRGDNEVGQNSDSSERQIVPVVTGGGQNRKSVLPFLESHPPHSGEIWPQRNRDASQRRMFCFKRVLPCIPPLDAAGNMRSLVNRGIKDMVCGGNSQEADSEQQRKANCPPRWTR